MASDHEDAQDFYRTIHEAERDRLAAMKHTAVFYFSRVPGPARQPLQLPTGQTVYVRVEVIEAFGMDATIGRTPLQDEEFMNVVHDVTDLIPPAEGWKEVARIQNTEWPENVKATYRSRPPG